MKVDSSASKNITKKTSEKLSHDDIKAKLKAKFGDKIQKKEAKPVEDKVDLKGKKGLKEGEPEFGDIKSNDPNSVATHEKLKGILKSGAFQFSDKERSTLAKILK
jgi:hypothetical protein